MPWLQPAMYDTVVNHGGLPEKARAASSAKDATGGRDVNGSGVSSLCEH